MTITITAKNSLLRLRLQSLLHKLRILNLEAEATLDNSSKKCSNVILTWWDKFFVHQFYLQKGFPGGSDGKESDCNVGDQGSIPGSGRSPGEGNGYPLQYSCLENPMNRGAWRATVHGVAQSRTGLERLSTRAHVVVTAQWWKHLPASAGVPGWINGLGRSDGEGNGNPLQYSCLGNPMNRESHGRLQSIALHRVGHDWSDLACTHTYQLADFVK